MSYIFHAKETTEIVHPTRRTGVMQITMDLNKEIGLLSTLAEGFLPCVKETSTPSCVILVCTCNMHNEVPHHSLRFNMMDIAIMRHQRVAICSGIEGITLAALVLLRVGERRDYQRAVRQVTLAAPPGLRAKITRPLFKLAKEFMEAMFSLWMREPPLSRPIASTP